MLGDRLTRIKGCASGVLHYLDVRLLQSDLTDMCVGCVVMRWGNTVWCCVVTCGIDWRTDAGGVVRLIRCCGVDSS